MGLGIQEIDIHEMSQSEAKNAIQKMLNHVDKSTYMIRVIHGFRHGNVLSSMIRRVFRTHPKVERIELSMNPGITDLIIKK